MQVKFLVLCILFSACGGSLTEEQRKKAKADIARNQIMKLSEAQITDAAFAYGRSVATTMTGQQDQIHSKFNDSLAHTHHVKIVSLRTENANLSEKEKRIVEAYAAITNRTDFTDNIQTLSTDSILYTKPVLKENSNGKVSFDYALGIRMPKKEIVLSIKH